MPDTHKNIKKSHSTMVKITILKRVIWVMMILLGLLLLSLEYEGSLIYRIHSATIERLNRPNTVCAQKNPYEPSHQHQKRN